MKAMLLWDTDLKLLIAPTDFYIPIFLYVHVYTYVHVHADMYMHTCIRIYIHTYRYTYACILYVCSIHVWNVPTSYVAKCSRLPAWSHS